MNLSIRQLRAFLGVVKFGNFTKAASQLHVTQAGLSAMIRELETQLRARLFDRTTRTVTLTDAGNTLLPYAVRAVENVDAAVVQLGLAKNRTQNILKVGVTPLIAGSILPAVLKSFKSTHPQVIVDVVDAELGVLQGLVETGEIDAAYGYLFNRVAGQRRRKIFSNRFALIAPASRLHNVERISTAQDWAALAEEPLIVVHRSNPLQALIDKFLADVQAPAFDRREVRQLATAIGMVAADMGISLIPATSLAACRGHPIRELPMAWRGPSLEHFCVTKAGRGEHAYADAFSRAFSSACAAAAAGDSFPPIVV